MLIRFGLTKDFFDELARDVVLVERSILRLTTLTKPLSIVPYRFVSVIASVRVNDTVVRLDLPCGELMDIESCDRKVHDRVASAFAEVREQAGQLNLEVRGGMFEVAP